MSAKIINTLYINVWATKDNVVSKVLLDNSWLFHVKNKRSNRLTLDSLCTTMFNGNMTYSQHTSTISVLAENTTLSIGPTENAGPFICLLL